MEMKKKQVYLAPALTVVCFKAERGYLGSSEPREGFLQIILEGGDSGSENLESRNDNGNYWGGEGDWF